MDEYIIKKTNPSNGSFIIKSYTTNGPENPNTTTLHEHAVSANTSLVLLGKGTFDYGEPLQTNLVNMLENFASDISPKYPIKGQLWYDTSLNIPILKIFNGTSWTYAASNIDAVVNDPIGINKRIIKTIEEYSISISISSPTIVNIPLTALPNIRVGSIIQLYEDELFDHDLGITAIVTAIDSIFGKITTNISIPTNFNKMVPLTILLPFDYLPDNHELQVSLNGIKLFNHVKGYDILYLPSGTQITDDVHTMIHYTEYNCIINANSTNYPITISRNKQNTYDITGFDFGAVDQYIEVNGQIIMNSLPPNILIKIAGDPDIQSSSTDGSNTVTINYIEYDNISNRTSIFFNETLTLVGSFTAQEGTVILNYPYTYENLIQDINNELIDIGHVVFNNNANPSQLIWYGNPSNNITTIELIPGTNNTGSNPIQEDLILALGTIQPNDQNVTDLYDYNEDLTLTNTSDSITINKSRLAGHTLEIIYTP